MSVAPASLRHVPHFRRPRPYGRGSTGPATDAIFSIAALAPGLTIRPDPTAPTKHAFVEPSELAPVQAYEGALVATRPAWSRVAP